MKQILLRALVSVFALASMAQAVTPGDGPGGVGATNGNSELELWVKADSLALANGAAVSAWNDSSGNGRNFTQTSASLRPVFVSSALGGKPVVRFTADSFANLTLPSANNEFAVVAVVKPVLTGSYHNIFEGQAAVRPMLWIDGIGNYEFNFNTGAVTPSTGNFDIAFAIKRSTGPQFSQLYLNGAAVTASGPNSFTIPPSQTYTFFNRSGSQTFSGDVAELIVFSTALTASEIGKIGYYLQQKYSLGTSFPSPFPVLAGYQQNPATYGVNVAIIPNGPIVSGGTASGFSIAPNLPAGLSLHPTSGVISGTPTIESPQATYTVTATFAGQPDSSAQLSLGVKPPTLFAYSRNPAILTRNRTITPLQPLVLSGPATGFSVTPALPPGLVLNAQTGVIAGAPNTPSASAVYQITATFNGYPPSNYLLAIEVVDASTTLDISEFMAANESTLLDGDGEYSDWIEIHNYGTIPIDLEGWYLTDNEAKLRKWAFPSRILAPNGYLIVFASGNSHIDAAGNLHAEFKLEASGEYLALVQPDGSTIARAFAPTFPAQATDVSYGTRDRVTFGGYAVPTPGAENGFFTAVSSQVIASPSGRAFAGTLNLTLAASLAPGAVIRYTVNGTPPTEASTVYSAPIPISVNVRVRARVFQPGLNPGPEASEVYLKLGADVQGFSSNLPLVFLNSDGAIAGTTSTTLTGTNAVIVPRDAVTGRASAIGNPNYAGRSGLRIRGRSSASFPQKQFKFETWDGSGRETDVPLLGLASSSDWVLNSPWSEKSLVRNALAYRTWETLGWPSLGTRFVEVFINDDGDGQFTYADDYAGVYLLVESIDTDRIGISEPQKTTNQANITGGFVTETGNADDQNFATTGSGRAVAHKHRDPDLAKLNAAQQGWIGNFIATFEQALYGTGFKHPTTGLSYSAYTNVASQVDYKIAREWSRNFDGGSTFNYVPRGGKLTMGPLWDYNWAFGNVNYAEGGDVPGYRTDGWNRSFTSNINGWAPWWLRFEQDPDWWQLFIDRWAELRADLLSDAAVNARIDAMTMPLGQEAAARNFARWPQLGLFTVVSPPGYEARTTYQSEIDYLKTWLHDRSAWIDSQFPMRPNFSRPAGAIASGGTVTLTAAPGASIYYTTNGSDPRGLGGGIVPGALTLTSGASVTINSSVILFARAKVGSAWSAPATVPYVTGTPASAQNLVISEIAYHPGDPTTAELASDPALSDDDFEFIEIHNISAGTIDLTGVRFTEGLRFTFPVGAMLASGGYVVVAENTPAFNLRYGAGAGVAGQYTGNLNNSSDTIVLLAASGAEIARIHYSDEWTPSADGSGYTLTLRDPENVPANYSLPSAWALSGSLNGSPGGSNGPAFTTDFALWQQSNFSTADLADPLLSGPLADPDRDGASNLLEMALVTLPLDPNSRPTTFFALTIPDIAVTFTRLRQALGINFSVEESMDCVSWQPGNAAVEVISQNGNTETVRLSAPRGGASKKFLRLRVTK